MQREKLNKYKNMAVGILLVFMGVLIISYNFTGNVIVNTDNGNASYSVLEDTQFLYNITVENTQPLFTSNITKVSVLFPDSFSFLSDSNGTSSNVYTFSDTQTELTWENDGLVMNLTANNFWFNLSASTPGDYNLVISTTNSTGITTSNIQVIVADNTAPSEIEFVSPTPINNSNLTTSSFLVNTTAQDNGVIDTITTKLFNSSFDLISSFSSNTSPLFVNFTGLSDGIYYFNSTVNDSRGNINSTQTRIITVNLTQDTTAPVITLISPNDSTSDTTDSYDFSFSVIDSSVISSCILIFDNSEIDSLSTVDNSGATNTIHYSSISVGDYVWSVNCTDSESNTGNSLSRDLTVSAAVSANTTTTTTTVTTTQVVSQPTVTENTTVTENNTEVSNAQTTDKSNNRYQKEMIQNENLSIDVKDETHTLNIKNITEKTVSIIIHSNPQEATFSVGEEKKFDVDEDGFYDLLVKLNFIDYNNSSNPKANFTVDTINEKIDTKAEVINNETDNKEKQVKEKIEPTLIVIPILIFTLLVAVVVNYIKSKKKKKNKSKISKH